MGGGGGGAPRTTQSRVRAPRTPAEAEHGAKARQGAPRPGAGPLSPGTMTLADLHQAIQAAMGWDNDHLHAFDIGGRQYGDRHTVDDVADENRLTLNSLLKSGVARFAYTDFGDNWEHMVVIEKSRAGGRGVVYPACVAGKRNCPPEDCGGAWGYQHLLARRIHDGESARLRMPAKLLIGIVIRLPVHLTPPARLSRRQTREHPPAASFDHLVGEGQERLRHGEAERFRGLEVDHQLELGRLLDRQIGRLRALEDLAGVNPGLAKGAPCAFGPKQIRPPAVAKSLLP